MAFERIMDPIPYGRMSIHDEFWGPRLDCLVSTVLPGQFEQIAHKTPRLENLRRAAKRMRGGFVGRYYDDSDVYKWLQACASALAQRDDAALRAMTDEAIGCIVGAQESDGYIHTYFQLEHPELRYRNLAMMHEMYCQGHLIEAAVEWHDALQDERLMTVADKLVDLLIAEFGPTGRVGYCGHQEIELALIRYAKARSRPDAASLAKRMVDSRGIRPSIFESELSDDDAMSISPWARRLLCADGAYSGEYLQDHAPVRSHRIVVGHAVRAMYLYTAAVHFAEGDTELGAALSAVWDNMTQRRMYVTGGIGSTASNEGFTNDYDLPNFNGYAETCASVGLALWGREMLHHSGDSSFADTMERAIFNGALAGISEDGRTYFYENPLESRRNHARSPWFECACCPPNIARMIAAIGQFAVSESSDTLFVHFPIGAQVEHSSGLQAEIESGYPYSASFRIQIKSAPERPISIAVRYPEWCRDATISIEGVDQDADFESGFIVLRRQWSTGDVLQVEWQMEPRWIRSHPMLFENLGRAALACGPLVYCLEKLDESEARHFAVDSEAEVATQGENLIVQGLRAIYEPRAELYDSEFAAEFSECEEAFVPYFGWSNNGRSSMSVWLDEV